MNIFEILLLREAYYLNKNIYTYDNKLIVFDNNKILNGFWDNTTLYEDRYYDIIDKERKIIIYMNIFEPSLDFEDYKIQTYLKNSERIKLLTDYETLIRIEKETFDLDNLENTDKDFKIINYEGTRKDCNSFKKENIHPNVFNKPHMIGYVRVSTHYQVKGGHSIEAQQKLIKDEAEKNDMYLRSIYIDAGISGKFMKRRTALKKITEEARSGDYVVFSDISRLARNSREHGNITGEFLKKKCRIKTLDMNMEYNVDPMTDMLLEVTASISAVESKRIGLKVKTGMKILKDKGELAIKPKYGYKRGEDHKNVINEEEMKIIDKLVRLRDRFSCLTRNQFYNYLNNINFPILRNSKKWSHRNAGKILDERNIY